MKKIRVCCSRSCTVFGARNIMQKIESETGLNAGEKNDTIDLDYCGCLGHCAQSPNVSINDDHYILTADTDTVMEEIEKGGVDMSGREIEIEKEYEEYFKNDIL